MNLQCDTCKITARANTPGWDADKNANGHIVFFCPAHLPIDNAPAGTCHTCHRACGDIDTAPNPCCGTLTVKEV